MKPHIYAAILLAALISFTLPAQAQSRSGNDIGGILEDIFGSGRAPNQYPNPAQTSSIDTIPVDVVFDPGRNGLPEEATLVVSAYAPPAPNVRRRGPKLIGETKLLLDDLSPPLSVVIAAPSRVTQEIDFARIEAKIVDFDGNILYKADQDGEFRGYDAPIMDLRRVGFNSQPTTQPPTSAGNVQFETVRGNVGIDGPAPNFRGGMLTVRLVEDGPAIGGRTIVGEKQISIDGMSPPYEFDFERTIMPGNKNTPLVLEAWIEDWANRKTHETSRPVTFTGAGTAYRLRLGPVPIGYQVPTQPPAPAFQSEARFNAFKGLPAGSTLFVDLERPVTGSRPQLITQTQVSLDGRSGNIPFTLDGANLDPNLPTPILRARVEDANGTILFSNPGGTPWTPNSNSVELRASAYY
ncbi:MAG: hypothetical protein EX271_02975 [Acidimicrobiales bacterium]|nr:hypothetical protein [Hyphomonadaceae bacterium]RZV43898.1 MAG: hypothetical protein EX271_02975 [Acidimicrobiales bacterium]